MQSSEARLANLVERCSSTSTEPVKSPKIAPETSIESSRVRKVAQGALMEPPRARKVARGTSIEPAGAQKVPQGASMEPAKARKVARGMSIEPTGARKGARGMQSTRSRWCWNSILLRMANVSRLSQHCRQHAHAQPKSRENHSKQLPDACQVAQHGAPSRSARRQSASRQPGRANARWPIEANRAAWADHMAARVQAG